MMNYQNNNFSHSFNSNFLSPNSSLKKQQSTPSFKKNTLTDILTVATININQFTFLKQQLLIDLINEKQINIIGISETWLTNKQAKFLYKHENNSHFIILTMITP
jgi:hypothetical protein